jgi:hypothetical protein
MHGDYNVKFVIRMITKKGSDDADLILQDLNGVYGVKGLGISMKLRLLCQITYFPSDFKKLKSQIKAINDTAISLQVPTAHKTK